MRSTLRHMDETFEPRDGQIVALPGTTLDTDLLPKLSGEVADRSMLVMQYVLAAVAAVCAVLLSRAS